MHKRLGVLSLIILTLPLFASASSCPSLTRTLARGMKGSDVTQLQQFLVDQKMLPADYVTGFFGAGTEGAVKKFQCAQMNICSGTPATTGWGMVGRATRGAFAQRCMVTPPCCKATSTSAGPGPIGVNPATAVRPPYAEGSYSSGSSYSQGSYYAQASYAPDTGSSKPLIGAFRWDAWWPNFSSVFPQYIPSTMFARWSYREPLYGWFDTGVAGAQAIMDQEIQDAADHGLDFWAFDDYWQLTQIPELANQAPLYDAFKEYAASANKSRIKFALAQSPGAMAYGDGTHIVVGFWNTYRPHLISAFKDPQYLKVGGNRPVLFILSDVPGLLAQWQSPAYGNWNSILAAFNTELKAAGLGDVYIVMTGSSGDGANTNGVSALSTYGVMGNLAKPTEGCTTGPDYPGIVHCPFSSQAAKDKSNWSAFAQSGVAVVPGLTPVNDSRAITSPYGFYVDQPTYSEWEQELRDAFAFTTSHASAVPGPSLLVAYAWNELAEGGPGIIPTKQNGMMYLDAIHAVKTGSFPSTYQDIYNGDNLSIVRAGSQWVNYAPIAGNYNADEEISQGIGESAVLAVANATSFEIKGTKGPNRGVMKVSIDGTDVATVTLTSSQWQQNATLFKSEQLQAGSHTLRIENVSTETTASQVGIDEIVVTKSR